MADTKNGTDQNSSSGSGMQRSSAARAKPARSAAGSVHEGSRTPGRNASTKEVTAARLRSRNERAKRQIDEQRVGSATSVLLERNPDYKPRKRVWWVAVIAALILTAITLAAGQFAAGASGSTREMWSTVTTVGLIAAYAVVVFALSWDWVKVRPLRNYAHDQALSLTEKAQQRLFAEREEKEAEERRAKREAKAAKKAAKSGSAVSSDAK